MITVGGGCQKYLFLKEAQATPAAQIADQRY
jgi:hypothetical protein